MTSVINTNYKYLSGHDREEIHQISKEIGKILPQINGDRKRIIMQY